MQHEARATLETWASERTSAAFKELENLPVEYSHEAWLQREELIRHVEEAGNIRRFFLTPSRRRRLDEELENLLW